jgi:glycosyltransferase involved in cell wall biosynthesis
MSLKYSIITINLNNDVGLERTIKSVINQSFREFEYIIIDGKSTDRSIEIINRYSEYLSFWISEKDTGIYNAMNKGIARATGEYCLFLNSGDFLINRNVLQNIFLSGFTEDIISGSVLLYSTNNGNNKLISIQSKFKDKELSFSDLFDNSLNHQATFIRRSLFQSVGYYNEEYTIISDWEFTLKCLIQNNIKFRSTDQIISAYDVDGRSSVSKEYYEYESVRALGDLIPQRILNDYKLGYLQYLKRIRRFWLLWTLFRIINKCAISIDTMNAKIKTKLRLRTLLNDKNRFSPDSF